MIIVLASNNAHKALEIQPFLRAHTLRTPAELGLGFDFPEDGDTFLANSMGKARALYELCGLPCLADDSGLCVDALNGRPGVHSARYGSPDGSTPLDAAARNELLLSEMAGRPDRSCRFVCCLSLVLSPYRAFTAQETCDGVLLEAPRGEGGFGYDPVVYLPELGRSVAELSPEEKNRVSHRGRALERLSRLLEGLS